MKRTLMTAAAVIRVRFMEVSRAFVSGGWSALSERKGGQRSRQVKLDG